MTEQNSAVAPHDVAPTHPSEKCLPDIGIAYTPLVNGGMHKIRLRPLLPMRGSTFAMTTTALQSSRALAKVGASLVPSNQGNSNMAAGIDRACALQVT